MRAAATETGDARNAPVGFSPKPLATLPVSTRSMCQLSVSPAAFFNVKAKTAPPFLMASFRAASLLLMALLMASKAADEGKLSGCSVSAVSPLRVSGWRCAYRT